MRSTGTVYVIEADNGEVKVGASGTPYARLSKIKREYGPRRGFTHARLVGFVPTSCPMAAEALVHRQLESLAVGGEWFNVDPVKALVEVLWAVWEFDAGATVRWAGRA